MRTALINVARVRPGTSEGITDLLLPQSSSGLREKYYSGRPSFPCRSILSLVTAPIKTPARLTATT